MATSPEAVPEKGLRNAAEFERWLHGLDPSVKLRSAASIASRAALRVCLVDFSSVIVAQPGHFVDHTSSQFRCAGLHQVSEK